MENLDSIFLGIFCFLMGAALVGGVIALRGRALKRRAAGAPPEPDLVEVAQLYRSRKTHRLVVSLDNQIHTSAGELSDDQHKRLSSVAAVLKTWLTEPSPAVQAAAAQVSPVTPVPLPTPAQALPGLVTPPAEIKPVAARPLEALNRALVPNPSQMAVQFKSIAAQINDVLQSRLPGSPYAGQGIALVETPNQGVVVRIGIEEYPGVEAVPDPEIRSFIKAAVAELEASTRRGIR